MKNHSFKAGILIYSVFAYLIGSSSLLAIIAWFTFDDIAKYVHPLVQLDNQAYAHIWNLILVIGFGAKHTYMAGDRFKNWYKNYFNEATTRSTYVLATGVYVFVMLALWAPLDGAIWQATGAYELVALAFVALGWSVLFSATFMINHFELFGLQQAWRAFVKLPPLTLRFTQRGFYRWVRHPIMTGLLIALWSTPHMTTDRFIMAIAMTLYVFVGLFFEERKLKRNLGDTYKDYCQNVGMLLPKLRLARKYSQVA